MRLDGWDYTTPAAYFVTICTWHRDLLFEDVRLRREVVTRWNGLPAHFPGVTLDAFVVMPNHVHGIIWLSDPDVVEGVSLRTDALSIFEETPSTTSDERRALVSLPQIVRLFKTHSARRINNWRRARGSPVWQRGYWEHIVRGDHGLERMRRYIAENPLNWESDPENPLCNAAAGEKLWDELVGSGALRLVDG